MTAFRRAGQKRHSGEAQPTGRHQGVGRFRVTQRGSRVPSESEDVVTATRPTGFSQVFFNSGNQGGGYNAGSYFDPRPAHPPPSASLRATQGERSHQRSPTDDAKP